MSKSAHFTGQPIFSQLLKFIDKSEIALIGQIEGYDEYIKKFDSYTHFVTLLFAVFERYDSIREIVVGLLSNTNRFQHLGIKYCIKRSTFAEANQRRSSHLFEKIYISLYNRYSGCLADSRLSRKKMKQLYIMDSITISLFCNILKGAGRNPKQGKKKGGIKVHTVIKADENIPSLIRYTSAATHDHIFLKEIDLTKGSFIVSDKGYVDYKQNERFTQSEISYVTKLKSNASYQDLEEFDIPDTADIRILKDEMILLRKNEISHKSRRITYWYERKEKLLIFLINNMELSAEEVFDIYRKRRQIESLFKQLKQNFPLKYFYGDNLNAIESQILVIMIANSLLTIIRSKIKRAWSFSNLTTMIR